MKARVYLPNGETLQCVVIARAHGSTNVGPPKYPATRFMLSMSGDWFRIYDASKIRKPLTHSATHYIKQNGKRFPVTLIKDK